MSQEERELYRAKRRADYHANKERRAAKHKEWLANPDNQQRALAKAREYKRVNRHKINAQRRMRRKTDPVKKVSDVCRSRLQVLVREGIARKIKKPARTQALIGCSWNDLVNYFETLFIPGMTWENHGYGHGKWVIDHIRPLCSFDLSIEEEWYKACHYTNLRPYWWIDNQRKLKDDRKQKLVQ